MLHSNRPDWGQLAVADVNGDNIPDVITYVGDGAGTLLGNGNGTFRQGPVLCP